MKLYATGSRFRVYLWEEEDGQCPSLDFLRGLWSGSEDDQNNADVFDRHLKTFANHGPPRGQERCRFFNNENVFEVKAHSGRGARLMGFYHPVEGGVVIFSHGFDKPRGSYHPEIKRAQGLRQRLKEESKSKTSTDTSRSTTKPAATKRATGRRGRK